jgi:hypothetical protein
MKVTNCCGAPFYELGYPDNDICSACKEHADAAEEKKSKEVDDLIVYDDDVALGYSIVKSNREVSGVFMVDGEIKDVDYFKKGEELDG